METATATMPPRLGPLAPIGSGSGPDPVDAHVGRRIRAARTERGISQDALAGAIGRTFQQVQKYERGVTRVAASMLYRLADALGVSITYFFADLGERPAYDPQPGDNQALRLARHYLAIRDPEARRTLMTVAKLLAEREAGE